MEQVNYYECTTKPSVSKTIDIEEWFNLIRSSNFSDLINQARRGELDYKDTKLNKVPCITYNFIYDEYRKDDNIIIPTGLMYIDIDDPSFNIGLLDKSKIYSFYKSFGGKGWCIVVKVSGLAKHNLKFNHNFICDLLGISEWTDSNAVKASQPNVISYDPDIYINHNAHIFTAIEGVPPSTVYINKREAYTPDGGTDDFKQLRYDNLDEIKVDGEYIVNWDGIPVVKCFIPMKKRDSGSNAFILSYASNLVWLNPTISEERVFNVLCGVCNIAFSKPVPEHKILKAIKSIIKQRNENRLQPIVFNKHRKIVFKKKSNFTADEKLSICRSEYAKHQTDNSKKKLQQVIENWDYKTNGKISIRKVASLYPISKKTVAKYWPEFKELVNKMKSIT